MFMFVRLFVPLFAVACAGGIKDGVTDTEPETAPLPGEGDEQQDDDSSEAETDQDTPAEDGPLPEDGDSVSIEDLGALTGIDIDVTYETWVDDSLVCAKAVAVTGTPYTGECEGCAFAFSIEGELVEDNSEAGCYVSDYQLLRTDNGIEDLVLAYSELLEVDRWGEVSTYADAVFVTYSSGWYGGGTSSTRVLSHADGGEDPGIFRRDGAEFVWGGDFETTINGEDQLVDYCDGGYALGWSGTEPSGVATITEGVSCDGKKVDQWAITIDETQTVEIAADTVSAETTFDPRLFVINEDGCVVASADDNFECTFPPPSFRCPASTVELEPGEYTILVSSFIDTCLEGTEIGEYELRIDAETPMRATLLDDDIFRHEQIPAETDYRAAGTLLTE